MCNGRVFPAWQSESIQKLMSVSGVDIALLIVRKDIHRSLRGKYARLLDFPHLLWTVFNKGYVERRSVASRSVDMEADLADVDEIHCQTIPKGRFAETFLREDVDSIRSHRLDLILRFSFGIIKGEILDATRYGVWSFHHGDEREYRGQPPGFWELIEGEKVMGSILQRLTERLDGGVVLHRGFFKVTPHSYRKTRDDAFLGSADWPSVVARQILDGDVSIAVATPSTTDAPVRRSPSNWQTVGFLASQAWAFVTSQWFGVFKAAKWTVGIADAPIAAFLSSERPLIEWVGEQGHTRYLADPFGLETDKGLVILVEDYDYRTRRGVISALDTDNGGKAHTVIDAGVHASYPYLFEFEGAIYCLPETFQANEIRLYRARNFPDSWELVTTIIDEVGALDPTLFEYGGRWWLFFTIFGRDSNTKVHAYHAPNPMGPWEPHLLNPIKTDIRSSRPAGTPFWHNGRLYRPTQDCSSSYGGGVTITRVDELSPTRFDETPVATVQPTSSGKYQDGIHTLSAVGQRTLVDGRRDTFISASFVRELRSRFDRILRTRT